DVEIAFGTAGWGATGLLEPRMLVGSVVDDQLGDDPQAASVGDVEKRFEIVERAVGRVDGGVIGDIVPIVLERRRVKGQEPNGGDAEVGDVIELVREADKIA